jgi:hypothetical protein
MTEVRDELKLRPGDQRRALMPLLDSKNVHVRLKTAITLLAIAPDSARKALTSVRDASMLLRSLDEGSYVPK